jgi:HD-GYP domain-containing protein (c-di-GMP phosphodiesterase class II)
VIIVPAIAEPVRQAANPTAGYLAVQVHLLQRLQQTTVDLFVQYDPQGAPVLYHRADSAIEPAHLAALAESGVQQVYVRSDDFQKFGANLLESVESFGNKTPVPPAERVAVLQVAVAAEIEHAARLIDCGPYVAVADKIGRELTGLLAANDVLPRDLFRLARHDFNTFTHVTNVASYGVILSEKLGMGAAGELELIAKAAILHDIGKRFIPASILTKPAKLDPEERAVIETHPQRGYEELCDRSDMSFEQLMIVYQHHERFDGKGYPVGLQGEEIHPWARMHGTGSDGVH